MTIQELGTQANDRDQNEKSENLSRLFPELTEQELKEAEHDLHDYFELLWRISERRSPNQTGQF